MDAEEAGWSCEEAGAMGYEAGTAGCDTEIVGYWKTVKLGGETEEKGLEESA